MVIVIHEAYDYFLCSIFLHYYEDWPWIFERTAAIDIVTLEAYYAVTLHIIIHIRIEDTYLNFFDDLFTE